MPLSASVQMPWFPLNASELFQGQLIILSRVSFSENSGSGGEGRPKQNWYKHRLSCLWWPVTIFAVLSQLPSGSWFDPLLPQGKQRTDSRITENFYRRPRSLSLHKLLFAQSRNGREIGPQNWRGCSGTGPRSTKRSSSSSDCRNHSNGWPWLEVQDVKSKATGQRAQAEGGANRLGWTAA